MHRHVEQGRKLETGNPDDFEMTHAHYANILAVVVMASLPCLTPLRAINVSAIFLIADPFPAPRGLSSSDRGRDAHASQRGPADARDVNLR